MRTFTLLFSALVLGTTGLKAQTVADFESLPLATTDTYYVNYSAFELPPAGQLGNAPRTLAGITGPLVQTLDLSVQKSFRLGEKRRLLAVEHL